MNVHMTGASGKCLGSNSADIKDDIGYEANAETLEAA